MSKYSDNISISRITVDAAYGMYRVNVKGFIGKSNEVTIESQIRETQEKADELARTLAIQFKLTSVHWHA